MQIEGTGNLTNTSNKGTSSVTHTGVVGTRVFKE